MYPPHDSSETDLRPQIKVQQIHQLQAVCMYQITMKQCIFLFIKLLETDE